MTYVRTCAHNMVRKNSVEDPLGWNGFISNVQIYNTPLSQNYIIALYDEGIGGAPINLQHLVEWWPLNRDTNDCSGNDNNGVGTGISFISQWTS